MYATRKCAKNYHNYRSLSGTGEHRFLRAPLISSRKLPKPSCKKTRLPPPIARHPRSWPSFSFSSSQSQGRRPSMYPLPLRTCPARPCRRQIPCSSSSFSSYLGSPLAGPRAPAPFLFPCPSSSSFSFPAQHPRQPEKNEGLKVVAKNELLLFLQVLFLFLLCSFFISNFTFEPLYCIAVCWLFGHIKRLTTL